MATEQQLILLVEDSSTLRGAIAELLYEHNFRVLTAENGSRGLQILQSSAEKPDAVLLDLMMPQMHGWQFMEELQRLPNYRDLPVIGMSAIDQKLANAPDLFGYLVKPVKAEDMLTQLREACAITS